MDTIIPFLFLSGIILLVLGVLALIADIPDLLRDWRDRNEERFERLLDRSEPLYELAREARGLSRRAYTLWSWHRGQYLVDSPFPGYRLTTDLAWLRMRMTFAWVEFQITWNLRVNSVLCRLIGPHMSRLIAPYTLANAQPESTTDWEKARSEEIPYVRPNGEVIPLGHIGHPIWS